jgi:hypothetical protein
MNPKHEYEVYTSTDKAQRDRLFQALRTSDDPFERQAVKFSGVEPVLGEDGKQLTQELPNYAGKNRLHNGVDVHNYRVRPAYRSTWSVAHPKAENF